MKTCDSYGKKAMLASCRVRIPGKGGEGSIEFLFTPFPLFVVHSPLPLFLATAVVDLLLVIRPAPSLENRLLEHSRAVVGKTHTQHIHQSSSHESVCNTYTGSIGIV